MPLDEDAVRAAARELRDEGVEAIAVCFLFSYLDPAHERARARDRAARSTRTPSSPPRRDVFPQFREFERFTTAAINAFVGPPVERYLRRLAAALRASGVRGRAAHHALERRRGARRPGGREAGARSCCPGRRRACSAAPGAGERSGPARPDHLRRRRHERGHRTRGRRRVQRGDGPRHVDRGLPGHRADDRHLDDRRGRRLDRLRRRGRRVPGRPAERGRRAGPGRLRARRRPSRPSPTPTSCSGGCDPDRFLGGEMALDADAARRGGRASSPSALGLGGSRPPPRAS